MSRQMFETCNAFANNNLLNKGNLSEFLKSYLSLAQSLDKSEIAYEEVSQLPPSDSLNNPDPRVDIIVSMCGESLVKEEKVSMVR